VRDVELVAAAIEVAAEGLAAGELPIGAVVASGEEIVGRAFTQERGLGRRLVHADLLAMVQADERLGWARREHPLVLAVSLEPCLMCAGAAMALGVRAVLFALESPGDGAAAVASRWPTHLDTPWSAAPVIRGGILRAESRELFRRYGAASDSGTGRWARTLAELP
jgi:tRNA(adenine34) deaminase